MHFHAIAERPAATPHAGVSWLLLGFVVLSLTAHALLFIPGEKNELFNVVHLGTPYIRVTLSEKPQPQADATTARNPTEHKPDTAAKLLPAATTPLPTTAPAKKRQEYRTAAPTEITEQATQTAATQSVAKEPAVSPISNAEDMRLIVKDTSRDASSEVPTPADNTRQREALRNYLLGELRDQLSRYLTYPQRARRRGWEGEVLLELNISTQGRLQDIQLVRSSGYAALDRSAIKSLSRVDKLKLPEATTLQQTVNLQLPVIYRLNSP